MLIPHSCTSFFELAVSHSVPFSSHVPNQIIVVCIVWHSRFKVDPVSLSTYFFLSFSLPQNRALLRAMVALYLFLSACFHSPVSLLARSLSFSLANRNSNSRILSPNPPPHSFYFSPSHCDGSQRPAQMRVISESILTDSQLGLEFVATL